jgi:hypothetical protein
MRNTREKKFRDFNSVKCLPQASFPVLKEIYEDIKITTLNTRQKKETGDNFGWQWLDKTLDSNFFSH